MLSENFQEYDTFLARSKIKTSTVSYKKGTNDLFYLLIDRVDITP